MLLPSHSCAPAPAGSQPGPRRRPALHGPSRLSGPAVSTPGPAGGTRQIRGGRATHPGLLALAVGRALSPSLTLKGGPGGRGHHPAATSRPVPLCPSPLPARWSETCGGAGGGGFLAASRLSKELTPFGAHISHHPDPLLAVPRPRPRTTYPARRSSAARAADSASPVSLEPPPGGVGSWG